MADLRVRLAEARNTIRETKATIEDVEHGIRENLLNLAGGNPKELGSNEQLREDRYRAEYSRNTVWIRSKADLLKASEEAEILAAVLDGRLDVLTERRLIVDERRTDVLRQMVESGVPAGALA